MRNKDDHSVEHCALCPCSKCTYKDTITHQEGFQKPNTRMGYWVNSGTDAYGVWAELTFNGVIQRFRFIPAGTFLMGSPEDEPGRYKDETQHEVEITKGFWLADTACTQELWEAVMGNNPSRFEGKDKPVDAVSFRDCERFFIRAGMGLRLPTEAEWEYACRAGSTTAYAFGDVITKEQSNYDGNGPVGVKKFPPNGWGLYQMHGNVFEWCSDWYGAYPEGKVIDPIGPVSRVYKAMRGGSWDSNAGYMRAAYRYHNHPAYSNINIGFRLARNSG